ncbi:MAG: NifB/NifX family molybdenum-iron cluster-binding protein [Candidatus Micrarchaeia archaeon]
MRILIPVLPQKEGYIISEHFGRAPFFAIYDTSNIEKPAEIIKNTVPPTMKERSGRGRLVLELLSKVDFDAIITKEIGRGAFYELSLAKKIYKSSDRTPIDALKKLLSSELDEINEPTE